MSKVLDWGSIAKVNFDDQRRKAHGQTTLREAFQQAHTNLKKAEDFMERRKEVEPILKSLLLDHMVTRKPITVLQPFQNPTEALGGIAKSEDDDGFYNSTPSSDSKTQNSTFEEVMETVPQGVTLTFKSWEKPLGQWVFKGSNGQEYAVYDKPVITFKGQVIENPGLFGLLYHTHLINNVD
jgi:hypothetical protein